MATRGEHIIYNVTEPILDTTLTPEVSTIDKWYKDHPRPVLRRALSAAILAGAFFFHSEPIVAAEDITIDKWWQPTSQPYFAKKRQVLPTGEQRFEVPREVLLSDWFQETKQPYFSKQRFYFSGESRFEIPREILLSDWWRAASEPTRRKPTQLLGGESKFELPRDILITDWFQPLSLPVKLKERRQTGGDTRTEVVVISEEITLDKWFQPTQKPVLRKVIRLQGENVRLDIIVDDTHINEWWQPTIQPYFSKRRNYFTGEFKFEVPRTILITDWFVRTNEPVRRKVQRLQGQSVQLSIIADDTQINEWYQPIDQPYFSKKRFVFTGEFKFEIPRTILLSDWWQQLPERNKKILSRLSGGEFRVEVITSGGEVITLDKWMQPIARPLPARKSVAQQDWKQTSLFELPITQKLCLESGIELTAGFDSFISSELVLTSKIDLTLTMNSYVYEPCV